MNKPFFPLWALLLLSCSAKDVPPPSAVGPVPTVAQLQWHEMEMNAFIHFSINTFTDKEWGIGSESPELFNPTAFDADQWVRVLEQTGFKGVILTCKHHDGFCLWPTKFSEHSVKSSPFEAGRGDVVRAVANACRKFGLKFGIYLSPWDRNHARYGDAEYIEYYRDQLDELFRVYSPVFEMWFDGANGGTGYYGGANEKRNIDASTYYDWPATLDLVRKHEPNVIFFSDAGPGVRWVGNERGIAGETNWNTISTDTIFAGKGGIEKLLNSGDENGAAWVPAETDVSIRPGWFYHQREDSLVKSPEQLFEIYLTSVGRGSTLLLNIPPDRRGLFHETDVHSLRGFRDLLDEEFGNNLAEDASVSASSHRGEHKDFAPENVADGRPSTYWTTNDTVRAGSIEIDFGEEKKVKYVVLQEYIQLGQRVRAFEVEAHVDGRWISLAQGTTIGYKRIIRVDAVTASKLSVNIKDARGCPLLSEIAVY